MEKKILCVGSNSYYSPFKMFGELSNDVSLLDKAPESVQLVVMTGGEDCSPEIYGEKRNKKTYCNPNRDEYEKKIFNKAVRSGVKIAGICRGSQFICSMSGGKLIQHLNGHTGKNHYIRTSDNKEILVTSTHHQNQLPNEDAEIVAWAEPALSDVYEGPPGVFYNPEKEADVVYYPSTKALGIQYHPEYMDEKSSGFKYVAELCQRFFGF